MKHSDRFSFWKKDRKEEKNGTFCILWHLDQSDMHCRISYSIVIKVMDAPARLHNGYVHHMSEVSLQCKNTPRISYSQWVSSIFGSFSYLSQGSELLNEGGKNPTAFYAWIHFHKCEQLVGVITATAINGKLSSFWFSHFIYRIFPHLVGPFFFCFVLSRGNNCTAWKCVHGDCCLQNEKMI